MVRIKCLIFFRDGLTVSLVILWFSAYRKTVIIVFWRFETVKTVKPSYYFWSLLSLFLAVSPAGCRGLSSFSPDWIWVCPPRGSVLARLARLGRLSSRIVFFLCPDCQSGLSSSITPDMIRHLFEEESSTTCSSLGSVLIIHLTTWRFAQKNAEFRKICTKMMQI